MVSSERFFPHHDRPLRTVDAHQELLASLTRITTESPPVHTCSTGWVFRGFYAGPTSVAYLFWRLSRVYGPDFEFRQQSLLEWAEAYLLLGQKTAHSSSAVMPDKCGIANEKLARLALSAVIQKDGLLVKQLCAESKTINSPDDDPGCGSNEWLYGRAGYLYFLRLCQAEMQSAGGHADTVSLLQDTMTRTVDRILAGPQPWTWHGKAYVGAAHGATGILTQVVLSVPSAAPQLRPLLDGLLDAQLPSGNIPSSQHGGADRLVQFCHGGAGFVMALRTLLPHFPALEPRIRTAVDRARGHVWRRGLLTKEPCLCHGIAGNALALAEQARFEHFVSFMGTEAMAERGWLGVEGPRDRADSVGLFTGEAGRAWVWAVADKRLDRSCIGFNDC